MTDERSLAPASGTGFATTWSTTQSPTSTDSLVTVGYFVIPPQATGRIRLTGDPRDSLRASFSSAGVVEEFPSGTLAIASVDGGGGGFSMCGVSRTQSATHDVDLASVPRSERVVTEIDPEGVIQVRSWRSALPAVYANRVLSGSVATYSHPSFGAFGSTKHTVSFTAPDVDSLEAVYDLYTDAVQDQRTFVLNTDDFACTADAEILVGGSRRRSDGSMTDGFVGLLDHGGILAQGSFNIGAITVLEHETWVGAVLRTPSGNHVVGYYRDLFDATDALPFFLTFPPASLASSDWDVPGLPSLSYQVVVTAAVNPVTSGIVVLSLSTDDDFLTLWSYDTSTDRVEWTELITRLGGDVDQVAGSIGVTSDFGIAVSVGYVQHTTGTEYVLTTARHSAATGHSEWLVNVYDPDHRFVPHDVETVGCDVIVAGQIGRKPGVLRYRGDIDAGTEEPIVWCAVYEDAPRSNQTGSGYQAVTVHDSFVYATGNYDDGGLQLMLTTALDYSSGDFRWFDVLETNEWGPYNGQGAGRSILAGAEGVLVSADAASQEFGSQGYPIFCRYPLGNEVLSVSDDAGSQPRHTWWAIGGREVRVTFASTLERPVRVEAYDVTGRVRARWLVPAGVRSHTYGGLTGSGVVFLRIPDLPGEVERAVVLR